jgi:hypothetical protein
LGKVAEEDESGKRGREHGDIFYLYVLAFYGGWRRIFDDGKEFFVEF